MIAISYQDRIIKIHRELGIPDSFLSGQILPLYEEATDLVDSEPDIFSRKQRMSPGTLDCWTRMKNEAQYEGVTLQLVSAFRGIEYQKEIIIRKLSAKQTIDKILKVNAAPGFSEHHTGRALDIGTTDSPPLTEAFEETKAFNWLCEHAGKFSFFMSYPKDNPYKIDYEPWHWACSLS